MGWRVAPWGCGPGLAGAASCHQPGLTLDSPCLGTMVIECPQHLELGQLTAFAGIPRSDRVKNKREARPQPPDFLEV